MDGLQNEILVVLLYLALLYEIITALKLQASKTVTKAKSKSPSLQDHTRCYMGESRRQMNRQDLTEAQSFNTSSLTRQSSRHFAQMRIIGRD